MTARKGEREKGWDMTHPAAAFEDGTIHGVLEVFDLSSASADPSDPILVSRALKLPKHSRLISLAVMSSLASGSHFQFSLSTQWDDFQGVTGSVTTSSPSLSYSGHFLAGFSIHSTWATLREYDRYIVFKKTGSYDRTKLTTVFLRYIQM